MSVGVEVARRRADPSTPAQRPRSPGVLVALAIAASLVLMTFLSLAIGSRDLPLSDVLRVVWSNDDSETAIIVRDLRWPRRPGPRRRRHPGRRRRLGPHGRLPRRARRAPARRPRRRRDRVADFHQCLRSEQPEPAPRRLRRCGLGPQPLTAPGVRPATDAALEEQHEADDRHGACDGRDASSAAAETA